MSKVTIEEKELIMLRAKAITLKNICDELDKLKQKKENVIYIGILDISIDLRSGGQIIDWRKLNE